MLDQLLVKQEISLLEVVLPFESSNKYSIFNSMGQNIYYAAEDSNICLRQICGPRRPWTVHVWSVLAIGLCKLKSHILHAGTPLADTLRFLPNIIRFFASFFKQMPMNPFTANVRFGGEQDG